MGVKRIMRLFAAFSIGVIGLLLYGVGSSTSALCSCDTPTVCQAFSRADTVFVGTLLQIRESENTAIETINAEFAVESAFKGSPGTKQVVNFRLGGCFERPIVGQKYFVYSDSSTLLSVCNRTRLLANATEDLTYAKRVNRGVPQFIISADLRGLSRCELQQTYMEITSGKNRIKLTPDVTGRFSYTVTKEASYQVLIVFPKESTYSVTMLGMQQDQVAKEIKYSLEFKPYECDHRTIEVVK